MILAPSLLAADLTDIGHALDLCQAGGAGLIHFDVMDGHFVPNLSFGIPVLEAVRQRTELPIDVHLMVSNPHRLLDSYLAAGADWISVHWETVDHLDRLLGQIREGGAKAGVALNPSTPVELLIDVLEHLDFVVLMSVNPGFGGQSFLPFVVHKARRLRRMIDERQLTVSIEMDGGIGASNIAQVVAAGVEVCVAGSATFKAEDPAAAMRQLKDIAQESP